MVNAADLNQICCAPNATTKAAMTFIAVTHRALVRACVNCGIGRFWRDPVGGKQHLADFSVANSKKMIGEPDTLYGGNTLQYDGRRLELRAKLLVVEGNIGVGKSTLAKKLAAELRYNLYSEPTSENPYLEKFYRDPHRYALKLQLWILQQRYNTYISAMRHMLTTGQGIVLDRSVFSDCVFANVGRKQGFISAEGYAIYKKCQKEFLQNIPLPHITVFLDASPQCCHNRMQRRGRECEAGVPMDYLTGLYEEYLTFIRNTEAQGGCVLKYDWSDFQSELELSNNVRCTEVKSWHQHVFVPSENSSLQQYLLEKDD